MQIDIRSLTGNLHPSMRTQISRRLRYALSRFGRRIHRALVRLEDLNGPRGGLDKRCHIEARVAGHGVMVAEVRDFELESAVSRAAERMARRVRDQLNARRDVRKRRALVGDAW